MGDCWKKWASYPHTPKKETAQQEALRPNGVSSPTKQVRVPCPPKVNRRKQSG